MIYFRKILLTIIKKSLKTRPLTEKYKKYILVRVYVQLKDYVIHILNKNREILVML